MEVHVEDFGTDSEELIIDYPDIASIVSKNVSSKKFDRGILISGTGIGMCIVANKFRGIRAAVVESMEEAERARRQNDINILCLGGDKCGWEKVIEAFLQTAFQSDSKHAERVKKIENIEAGRSKKSKGNKLHV